MSVLTALLILVGVGVEVGSYTQPGAAGVALAGTSWGLLVAVVEVEDSRRRLVREVAAVV